MPTPLDTESLFAAIGLDAILAAKPTLHKYQLNQAANLPKELRRRVLAFLASDGFQPGKDVPEFDYAKTLEVLSAGQTSEQAKALFAVVPDHELATDMGNLAGTITQWGNSILPREDRQIPGGPLRRDEPTPAVTADFRRVWNVVRDPMIVLDDLEDGSLADEQVSTLKQVYPAIYAELRQAISDDMATMSARKGDKWEPNPLKSKFIATILQQPTTDPSLTAAIQAIYAKSPDKVPTGAIRPARTPADTASQEPTPGQKAAG